VICPHCRGRVGFRNRTGNRCGSCNRKFALEPKRNAIGMHDVRLRRLFDDLGHDDMRYTVGQLYYASMRKDLRRAARPRYGFAVGLVAVAAAAAVCGFGNGWWIPLVLAGLLLVACAGYVRAARAGRFNQLVRPPLTEIAFARTILARWRNGYGQDPPGLVRESATAVGPNHPDPVLAVLSPSDTVLVSLWANDIKRRKVALAKRVEDLPARVPVALLHDVSVAGYLFADRSRTSLAGRIVVDLTPRPQVVRRARRPVLRRDEPPRSDQMQRLRTAGRLTDAELSWLGKGWWSPIAAMRPAVLMRRVGTAVDKLGDPARRTAAAVGFLTWPGATREATP
jgi:hypothetical protein